MKTVILAAAVLLAGCAPGGIWRRNFKGLEPNPFPPSTKVEIYTVEPERLAAWLEDENRRQVASDVPLQNRTRSMRLAYIGRMLRTMRVPERPEDIAFLGSTFFVNRSREDIKGGTLEALAKDIGADYVGVTCAYTGKTAASAYMPVFSNWSNNATAQIYGRRGYLGSLQAQGSGRGMSLIPTTIVHDNYLHAAFFFRKFRSQSP